MFTKYTEINNKQPSLALQNYAAVGAVFQEQMYLNSVLLIEN